MSSPKIAEIRRKFTERINVRPRLFDGWGLAAAISMTNVCFSVMASLVLRLCYRLARSIHTQKSTRAEKDESPQLRRFIHTVATVQTVKD